MGLPQPIHIHAGAAIESGAFAEIFRRNRGNGLPDARIGHGQLDVRAAMREASTSRQRRNYRPTVYVVDVVNVGDIRDIGHVGDVGDMNTIETASIPREEGVMRPARQPSNGAKAQANVKLAMSKAYEEHIGRSVNGPIGNVYRSRIPVPRCTVKEPSSIVIGRPTPRLIGNPRPTIVRLPHPAANLIGRPGSRLVGRPRLPVAGNIGPVAIAIQVLYAGVVTIGPAPALGVADDAVTIFVPTVPVIFAGSAIHPEFRGVRTPDGDLLPLLDGGASLGRGDLGFAFTHDHVGFSIGIHLNAISSVLQRTNRYIGSIDLDIGFSTL